MNPTENVPTVSCIPLAGEPDEALSQREDPLVLQAVEEYLAARQAGRAPERQAFLAKYSAIAARLADCLDGLEFIRSAAPQLQESGLASCPKSSA